MLTRFVAPLVLAGAISGPPLDGIHSHVHLLLYDRWPVEIGPLHTSLAVPVLLAAFYAVIGGAHVWLDGVFAGEEATRKVLRRVSGSYVALTVGLLAALLQLSAMMYDDGVQFPQIAAALAVCAAANWLLLDGTKQGLLLATLCALGAPAAELLLMRWLGLWHYPRGDLFGIPSWVACCYFFYTPFVGNLSRWVWRLASDSSED